MANAGSRGSLHRRAVGRSRHVGRLRSAPHVRPRRAPPATLGFAARLARSACYAANAVNASRAKPRRWRKSASFRRGGNAQCPPEGGLNLTHGISMAFLSLVLTSCCDLIAASTGLQCRFSLWILAVSPHVGRRRMTRFGRASMRVFSLRIANWKIVGQV